MGIEGRSDGGLWIERMTKPVDQNDRRRIGRPLTAGELRTLIESTRHAPQFRKVSGVDRAALYWVAPLPGFDVMNCCR